MKKEILLEKIELLFYENTFKNVSMQDIATKLDIKKASLYYYFPSKEELIKETIKYSFKNYKLFIEALPKNDLNNFIYKTIYFPNKSKNLFSIINQNGYCSNFDIKNDIQIKQKEIFDFLSKFLLKNYNFSVEKSFLLISLLDDLGKKRCLFGKCPIDIKKIKNEILNIFK